MSLMRWDPFGDVDAMFNRLVPGNLMRWPRLALRDNDGTPEWSPSADISETETPVHRLLNVDLLRLILCGLCLGNVHRKDPILTFAADRVGVDVLG
jgi:hypothetical protein